MPAVLSTLRSSSFVSVNFQNIGRERKLSSIFWNFGKCSIKRTAAFAPPLPSASNSSPSRQKFCKIMVFILKTSNFGLENSIFYYWFFGFDYYWTSHLHFEKCNFYYILSSLLKCIFRIFFRKRKSTQKKMLYVFQIKIKDFS